MEAFHWFYVTYLECVCGKRNWGRQKQHELVPEATKKGSGCAKTETISDEAFALLSFENYVGKWISTGTTCANGLEDDRVAEFELPGEQGRKKQPRHRGKYTSKKSGHCKYGGGVARVWLGLTSYTNWSERTELARRPLPWKKSYGRIAKQSMVAVLAVQKEERMKALPMQCQQQRKCRLSKPRGTWMTRSGYGILDNNRNEFL